MTHKPSIPDLEVIKLFIESSAEKFQQLIDVEIVKIRTSNSPKDLLQNWQISVNEIWHVVKITLQVLQFVSKSPCDDLDLFYGKVNIGLLCI